MSRRFSETDRCRAHSTKGLIICPPPCLHIQQKSFAENLKFVLRQRNYRRGSLFCKFRKRGLVTFGASPLSFPVVVAVPLFPNHPGNATFATSPIPILLQSTLYRDRTRERERGASAKLKLPFLLLSALPFLSLPLSVRLSSEPSLVRSCHAQ